MYVYTIAFAAAVTDSGFYAEIQIIFGTVWRFIFFWDSVKIHIFFWDSVENQIFFYG